MKRIILAALVGVLVSGPVWADFIVNYGDWRKLSLEAKRGFVMGIWDGSLLGVKDLTWLNARAGGYRKCGQAVSLDSDMLVDAMDKAYKSQTEFWDKNAGLVMHIVLHNLCLEYVNTERVKEGLKPWPR